MDVVRALIPWLCVTSVHSAACASRARYQIEGPRARLVGDPPLVRVTIIPRDSTGLPEDRLIEVSRVEVRDRSDLIEMPVQQFLATRNQEDAVAYVQQSRSCSSTRTLVVAGTLALVGAYLGNSIAKEDYRDPELTFITVGSGAAGLAVGAPLGVLLGYLSCSEDHRVAIASQRLDHDAPGSDRRSSP